MRAEHVERVGGPGPIRPAQDLPVGLEQRDDFIVAHLIPEQLGQEEPRPDHLGPRVADGLQEDLFGGREPAALHLQVGAPQGRRHAEG